jgi:hypothetical protein
MKEIPSLPGYFATEDGRIYSTICGRSKGWQPTFLTLYQNSRGYIQVNAGGRTRPVHRLVAEAFHGPCPDGFTVDHINGVKNDNRPENLRYLTVRDNVRSAWADGRGHKNSASLTTKEVLLLRYLYRIGYGHSHLLKVFGISSSAFYRYVNGERNGF